MAEQICICSTNALADVTCCRPGMPCFHLIACSTHAELLLQWRNNAHAMHGVPDMLSLELELAVIEQSYSHSTGRDI